MYISQKEKGISQTGEISAKLGKYQPKRGGNQPNWRNISQREERISQTGEISAKGRRESAKLEKYQPKGEGNQPNKENISQSGGKSAKASKIRCQITNQPIKPKKVVFI
ncbi:hypothetical protein M1D49_21465 [Bacillus sp. PK3-056]|uniref:hypothetical protein n=1 Tax=Niallia circulans TaxID=1397 RepID=UPI000F44E0BD|nr:hypothetical protein [Niallia circulans]AYV72166.1 hypothetical protein C2H98_11590 [Niallia circulans]